MQISLHTRNPEYPLFEIFRYKGWGGVIIRKYSLTLTNIDRGFCQPNCGGKRFIKMLVAGHSNTYGVAFGRYQLIFEISKRV